MELEISALAGGGAGVGRCDGAVWFVRGALPGERVEAAEVRVRAGVVEAEVTAVLRASPQREPEPCPVAGECGGCSLAHVRREAAAAVLREVAIGALRHAPRLLADTVAGAAVVVSPWRSRLRARLHWDAVAGRLGFFAARSHRVVGLSPCRIVSARLHAALPGLEAALARSGAADGEVEWLEDLGGESAVAGWDGPGGPPRGDVGGLGGWWRVRGGRQGWGEDGVTMELPVPLRVPIGSFFQANRDLVPSLFERVAELVRGTGAARLVDLYAGVGFLAAAGRHGGVGDVVAVEPDARAAAAARHNLEGATVHACTAERYLVGARRDAPDLAIVDAPRAGLSASARSSLLRLEPASVLILSCDVARFGRDAAALLAAGYSLETLELWDLFAGSHHVEVLALFRR